MIISNDVDIVRIVNDVLNRNISQITKVYYYQQIKQLKIPGQQQPILLKQGLLIVCLPPYTNDSNSIRALIMSTLHCHPLYSNYAFINLLSNNLNLFLVFPIESILSLNCLVSKYLFLNTICLNFYKAYLFIVIVIVMSNLVCLNRTVQLP